eukprot:1507898-Amphidinium_carterae.1
MERQAQSVRRTLLILGREPRRRALLRLSVTNWVQPQMQNGDAPSIRGESVAPLCSLWPATFVAGCASVPA